MFWTLKKILFRVIQRVMKLLVSILPFREPELLTGPGSVIGLAEKIKEKKLNHVLVVTDTVLMDLNVPLRFLESLTHHNINYTVFKDVQPNPTIENVENGKLLYKQSKCDGIIGFGGGSPIDCAKIIGARISNPFMSVKRMKGFFKVFLPTPPVFCVPTTAGTGSETTVAAVITDADTHEKFAISDLKLIPHVAVLDPELMVGLPPHITAATGMDALTHAIEAFIGLNGTPFTNEKAKKATQLIIENLEKAYLDGSNLEVRNNMALASYYAGEAFTRSYIGYVHAIAHNMGGIYGVPHGLANAVILPFILDFCRREAEPKLAELAIAGGIGNAGEPQKVLADNFIKKVRNMNENMKIPTVIKELKEKDIPLIAKRALKEAHPDYPVPRIMRLEECEDIVKKLLP